MQMVHVVQPPISDGAERGPDRGARTAGRLVHIELDVVRDRGELRHLSVREPLAQPKH